MREKIYYCSGKLFQEFGFEALSSNLRCFQAAELRRRETLRLVEETVRQETMERKSKDNDPAGIHLAQGQVIDRQVHE